MKTTVARGLRRPSLATNLAIQFRVIGALLMRELHTRYGRENIGYLWLIGEPLMLGSVIALLHSGSHVREGGIDPVAFTVVGYTNYIMFRGIVSRAEGTLHSNLPLLYHKMVTVFDVAISRALLEAAGTTMASTILVSLCISLGYADLPARPLYLIIGTIYLFWMSFGVSLIIVGGTHDNTLLERLVHPFTYFMIPLSGAFYEIGWIPEPYRGYLVYVPLPHVFEIIRYGVFESAPDDYLNFEYVTAFCMVLSFFGLVAVKSVRYRVHLN
jgi:capsular polysaccharide transport system permease protein